jgi:hypothetical protein
MKLEQYSMGVGDRFGHQGKAQLAAMVMAQEKGVDVTPVWNKSKREHSIIHTLPKDTRAAADAAVKAMGWKKAYHVDADHIGLKNVDGFIEASDFFTLDVADFIGQATGADAVNAFAKKYKKYAGAMAIPGINEKLSISEQMIEAIARKYLLGVREAGKIYRHIQSKKNADAFITEVSMDETSQPQTPVEMLFILAAIAEEHIPAQTIAPKFTGRFNKGVDYVGTVSQFAKEFEEDLAVIAFAVKEFGLPKNLKLSVHSGSDKFSIYKPIHKAIKKFNAGLHLKTAGTTWLEEVIGLAMAGGEGLAIAKKIYANALGRFDELCGPYATVIDIDEAKLPSPEAVAKWSSEEYVAALQHNQSNPKYNPNLRQMIHVGYKVAVELGSEYIGALEKYEDVIAKNVTENIFERHIKPIFIG